MNKVDLLFIVDITGSMGGFIATAKEKMQSILESLSDKFGVDLRVGFGLYRDHPSQGDSFVTAVMDLVEIEKTKDRISMISVGGGGDPPEAVLCSIAYSAKAMSWREGSRRIGFIIGDAPAHGMLQHESCCTCGLTWGAAVSELESRRIILYSIVLGGDIQAKDNFRLLSNFTGGMLIEDDNAMNAITETLRSEFDNLCLDSQVLEMLSKSTDVDKICDMLNITRDKLNESKTRITQFSI